MVADVLGQVSSGIALLLATLTSAVVLGGFTWLRKARRRDLKDAIRSEVPTIPEIQALVTNHAALVAGQTNIAHKLDGMRVENGAQSATVAVRLDGLTNQVIELARTQSSHGERLARLEARNPEATP